MDDLAEKISAYLQRNPNSNARDICKEVGADKSAINSCLYSNIETHFLKEGLTPPLWRNAGDSPKIDSEKVKAKTLNDSASEEEIEDEDEDWALLDAEDQQKYRELSACVARGEVMSRLDKRRINQLRNQIERAKLSYKSLLERQERKVQNRSNYFVIVDKKVNEIWNVDEQHTHAIEALKVQFESNLRKLAYGYLTSSSEKLFDGEGESEIETRQAKSISLLSSVVSTIEARLNSLENLTDEELIISSVRFGWMRSDGSIRPTPKLATEIFPRFEESEIIKNFRSRFQEIIQRISRS